MFVVFLAHPYRNDSFGWESDLANVTHMDLADFYHRHYQPGNAVLAVVGDVAADDVRQRVERYFRFIPGAPETPPPHTIEPRQTGERRMELRGDVGRKFFRIAWRAPSVHHPDYPAFLLLQDLLAGGSGVSFLQNDWGTPVRAGSPLDGITEDLTTWFPPTQQEYVFTIGGSAPRGADERAVEDAIGSAIAAFRYVLTHAGDAAEDAMKQAKKRVREALVFDVQTTEDAAHHLAFFTGLDALDVLIGLPLAVEQVSAADVVGVMERYLKTTRRTVGWYVPGEVETAPAQATVAAITAGPGDANMAGLPGTPSNRKKQDASADSRPAGGPAPPPGVAHLSSGIPVVFQRSALSPTASLKVVTSPATFPPDVPATANDPLWGVTSLDFDFLPEDLPAVIARAGAALKSAATPNPTAQPDEADPAALLERYFQELLGLSATSGGTPGNPLLLVLCGDIDPDQALPLLEAEFGSLNASALSFPPAAAAQTKMDVELRLERPVAQEQIGYVVRAPGPGQPDVLAWRLALYIFSHEYEGRLGTEAISRRGLVYYLESDYESDGRNGWITLSMGVDPDKQPALKSLLQGELRRMIEEPPSQQEIDEAKRHLLGRQLSAAQSNPELTDRLARQWLWNGQLISHDELQRLLEGIRRDDVIRLLPAFVSGSIISIRNPVAAQPAAGASGQ